MSEKIPWWKYDSRKPGHKWDKLDEERRQKRQKKLDENDGWEERTVAIKYYSDELLERIVEEAKAYRCVIRTKDGKEERNPHSDFVNICRYFANNIEALEERLRGDRGFNKHLVIKYNKLLDKVLRLEGDVRYLREKGKAL